MLLEAIGLILILIAVICVFVLLWRTVRPKFSVRVTCWFCGERTVVPYGNKNCWDCPSCEQYNGFDQAGGYNKPIPAQYDERLNHPVGCDQEEFISGDELLCSRCSQNQLLKVKQLANFVPYNEKNYDSEIEAFERHLEKVYRLCLSCQTRVQQELQLQNEAIGKRLQNLNVSSESFSTTKMNKSFDMNEGTSTEKAMTIKSSILHGISLVCAALLVISKLQLDSYYSMINSVIFLHPILVWLDRHVVTLAVTGLFTGLTAKLLLGKYRLHLIDVISCPVWLLVLLLQTRYIPVQHSSYDVISSTANLLTCVVCLGINRSRRNQTNMNMTRLSLDPTDSQHGTTVSQFSSVSQPTHTQIQQSRWEPKRRSYDQSHDQKQDGLDDTLTELDSFTLGAPAPVKRSDSGVFSSFGQSSDFSNLQNQSVSQALRKNRPLISPATFNVDSPTSQRNGNLKFGLFSTPQVQRQTSFTDQPLSGMTLTSRSFSVPKTTAFGATPFSVSPEKIQLSGRSLFETNPITSPSSSSFGRQTSSERSFTTYRGGASQRRTSVRKDLFTQKGTVDSSNEEDDRISSFSGSTVCPVDSTTSSAHLKRTDPFWKHPGFIGFVLGGSIVANILLLVNFVWRNHVP